jgi:hypothetical protein
MIDRNRLIWTILAAAFAAAVSLAAVILLGTRAHAHDWYPLECCHSIECAPVDHVKVVAGAVYYADKPQQQPIPPSVMIVTTKKGTAVVPPDLPRRESKDNRMHACMRTIWTNGVAPTTEVTCIFLPPAL